MMIDPNHVGLSGIGFGRRAEKAKQSLNRKMSDSSSKSSGKQAASQRSASASQSDVPPLPSAYRQDVGGKAKNVPYRNPELEQFKQQTALNTDLVPRKSDFFSKRRTSVSSGVVQASATGSASTTGTSTPTTGPKLPAQQKVRFDEDDQLHGEPLPVRLGLAPPLRTDGVLVGEHEDYKARVGHGYYFCLPPPQNGKRRDNSSGASGSSSARTGLERRRNTTASEASTNSSSRASIVSASYSAATTVSSTAPALTSPVLTPDSPLSLLGEWGTSSADSHHAKSLSPPTTESGRPSSLYPPSTTLTRPHARSFQGAPGFRSSALSPRSSKLPAWDPADYFVTWTSTNGRGRVREYKHHAFPRSKVPYWYGYDADSIEAELDIHLCTFSALNGSHVLRRPPEDAQPSRVLDLGCGAGAWCVDVAREWKQAEFIGVDICPIQTPIATMRSPDLERRISWVVANFLEKLPFPDNSFDFIHMRYLGNSIPEDKWADVITEVERVLAPGGKLEILENNYHFFGRVQMYDAEELFGLQHGKPVPGAKPKLPQPLRPSPPWTGAYDIDAIQVVVERTIGRRFINPMPLSVIPSMLLTEGLTNVAIGNPRHIPLQAESSRQRAAARARRSASSSTSPSSSDNDEKWKAKFTSRSQIGQALNSSFHIMDPDVWRALGFLHFSRRISGARELIWLEAEEEKQRLLRQNPSETAISSVLRAEWEAQRGLHHGHPASLKPFVHPWKTKMDFFKDLDLYVEDMVHRADMESIVEKHLGWSGGSEELTVEGRKQAERQKKLNEAAALPVIQTEEAATDTTSSVPTEPTVPAEEPLATPAPGDGDWGDESTLGRKSPLGFSVAASRPCHEAPGRMQTTEEATKGEAEEDGEAQELLEEPSANSSKKAGDARNRKESSSSGKRRKPIRPTSSGGVATMGFGALPRPMGQPAVFGEASLYGNLFMAGGQAKRIPVTGPIGPGMRTPSQRAAAEFAKKKSGSSGASIRSGSSASTGKTASTAKTGVVSASGSGSGGGSSNSTKKSSKDKSPDPSSSTAVNAKDSAPIISLSEPVALQLRSSIDGAPPAPSTSTSSGTSAAVPGQKITAANVFNIPPATASPKTSPSPKIRGTPAPEPPALSLGKPSLPTEKLVDSPASTSAPLTKASPSPEAGLRQLSTTSEEPAKAASTPAATGAGPALPAKSSTKKPRSQVALLGFFDTTGYMATAV